MLKQAFKRRTMRKYYYSTVIRMAIPAEHHDFLEDEAFSHPPYYARVVLTTA